MDYSVTLNNAWTFNKEGATEDKKITLSSLLQERRRNIYLPLKTERAGVILPYKMWTQL